MSDEHPTSPSSQTNPSTTTTANPDTTAITNPTTTATTTTATSDSATNDSSTSSPVLIGLQIKSLEQRTHSVTLPRNASVLELKNEIQTTLDVDSGRQRLIFQGKVLKDDKNLMDYANLDDGKVIHLVIRPLDAPQNPMNDEPRPTGRRIFGNRGRPFPSIASRLPMMEGYTFITLDAHIGDNGDNNSFFSSIMNGLTGANPFNGTNPTQNGRSIRSSSNTTATNQSTTGQQQQQQPSTITSNLFPSFLTRSPFELRRSLENASNTNDSNTTASSNTTSTATNSSNINSSNNNSSGTNNTSSNTTRPSSIRLPLPSSVEMRLSRSVAYIRNVSNILEAPVDQQMSQIPYTSASSPDFIQEIRSTLRGNGNSQSYQVGMVMNELSDLMERGTPWLRETARTLQDESAQTTNEENVQLFRRVLRAARVIQGMSLINHFMGSVLTSVDMDGQRSNGQESMRTSMFEHPIGGESWLGGNEGTRSSASTTTTTAPTTNDQTSSSTATTSTTTPQTSTTKLKESSASTATASSSSSSSSASPSTSTSPAGTKEEEGSSTTAMEVDKNGNKRKREEDNKDETTSNKQHSSAKGKSKNKTD
ncbi:hypothetical protein BCR42DRAFT_424188 [Absidia repens]|uniref:Ubiquitin-like domain-containing protein n=1 Tax=Absidia repens TaxID=90262 RepID=A0A1X2I5G3_9FUNG|nr:hypothetical protein BCR42DRAFT_424188 [Absidia repens]